MLASNSKHFRFYDIFKKIHIGVGVPWPTFEIDNLDNFLDNFCIK